MMFVRMLLVFLFIVMETEGVPGYCSQDSDPADAGRRTWLEGSGLHELVDNFESRINFLAYGAVLDVERSRVNPGNVLKVPRQQAGCELRPDFYTKWRRLELGLKPRAELYWQRWREAPLWTLYNPVFSNQTDTDTDLFVNEWLTRFRVTNALFVSYERENLQWGPSYLLSPSNPFNSDNGRDNPWRELPGLDYAKIVWLPGYEWTVSGIVNIDEGRLDVSEPFHKVYALKIDYIGRQKYVGLIGSYREGEEKRFGFFGGWTVSDALFLYAEGSVSDEDEAKDVLVGATYTTEGGSMFTTEFYRNGDGCTCESVDQCFAREFSGDLIRLYESLRDRDRVFPNTFLRKNYLMLQFTKVLIDEKINVVLRWVQNFDDDSARSLGMFGYDLTDNTQIFAISNIFFGDDGTEYGSLLDFSFVGGLSYTF